MRVYPVVLYNLDFIPNLTYGCDRSKEIGMKEVTIIGSGLAGTLLALYLAKRDYKLEVFDARPDLRLLLADDGRSNT